ncbi:leukocyte cysteine proteinase inhibitor 1-like [Micropterus salmoides]|uniref:leukocyte cysteine proteinase inhibitor 1-like n=1 Tax=Micropterus salmoides TaxID=27706 RepID=UPI0018EDA078|nr:leukocyte cysteine proteinase inhibitor 1-like [Micropterus salmoides]
MAEQWGPTKKATLQQISEDVKDQVEKTTGKDFEKYRAVLYRKRDTNPGVMKEFLIKVNVGGPDYIHLWVRKEDQTYKLFNVKQKETKDSPLVPIPANE